jgi:hypothetical protein
MLEDYDVVVYRAGTWTVDGVEVGDGSFPLVIGMHESKTFNWSGLIIVSMVLFVV